MSEPGVRKGLRLEGLLETPVGSERPFPSREPVEPRRTVAQGQVNIRANLDVLEGFREMCRLERRSYGEMLERLMHAYGSPRE